MKRIYSFLFVTMAMLMLSVSSAWAQYVKLTAEDGTESWIEIDGIINGTNIEIFKGRYESAIDRNTTGSIDLNEVWSLSGGEGTQYQVTNIGSFAFYECRGLTYVDIPSSVTSIREWAFSSCSGLTSVDIPSNVTSIEECAFSSCSGLTSVTMENGLTSIGHQAFDYCSGLTSIAIPSSVTSIGDGAFLHCSGLTSVTIPNSVTNIGGGAFSRCSGLTSIEIPSSVTNIGDYVFYECSGLTSIVIPSSVTSIGWYAFYGCSGMTSVTIPSNVTSIGKYAFYGCSGLTSVTVPSSVTNIEDYAFCLCSGLTSVDIPFSVNSIGDYAFCRCSGLTSVDIPSNVTTIGKNAFYGCTGLTSVTIPSSVTSIEDYAFVGCSGLISIVVESGNSIYDSRNNCNAIIETSTNSLIVGSKNTKIPSSVTGIKKRAFRGCIGLTSMTIPNSVTSIEPGAFAGCIGLTSIVVELGNSVYDSRNNCNAIIETASNTLIAGCNNTVIPNSVTSIGEDAFWDYSGLTSIEIPSSVISIGFGAFYGCSGLTSVDIPNSVKRIGEDAFYGCSGLTSVTIPNSVTSIGYYAFKGCFGLTSVTIGNSLKSIGEDAFSGCNSLNKVIVNDIAAWCSINFDSWETNPLSKAHHLYSDENTEITNLIIPSSVKSIGENAFYDCSGLTSVEISNNVTSIGSSAFSGCSGLTSVTIGNSVKSIGRFAFSDCIGLISVTIPNSVTSIEYHAFSGCSCIVICNSKTPPTADDYTFNENMIAIVPDNLVSTYKNATGWKRMSFNSPCIAQRTTQTSITLYTSSLFSNVKAVLNGISFYPQADSIKITGLDPNTTYTISLSGDVGDIHLNSQMSVTTKNINLSIQLVKRTNLTLRLKGFVSDSDDAVIASSGFEDFEGQDEIYVQGLTPGMSYSYTYYVKAASGKKYTKTESFQTIPVDMNVNTSVCSSSAQLTGTYSVIDAIITECGFDGFQNQVFANAFISATCVLNGRKVMTQIL